MLLSAVIQKWNKLLPLSMILSFVWEHSCSVLSLLTSSFPSAGPSSYHPQGFETFVSRKSLCEVSASAKSNPAPALISFGRFSPPEKTLGAFYYVKDSGNFCRISNGKVRFGFFWPEYSGSPRSLLFRSEYCDRKSPFHFFALISEFGKGI